MDLELAGLSKLVSVCV
uniref:Uncharacterized protein n=1 Tax=Anguilla anguilla TaxID=7936 RepID=A0A0E9XUF3_ANGAN